MNYQQFSKIKNLLFMDIETASGHSSLDADSLAVFPKYQADLTRLWTKKQAPLKNDENLTPHEMYVKKAALFPEFGKIICISFAWFEGIGGEKPSFELKKGSFCLNLKNEGNISPHLLISSEKDLIEKSLRFIAGTGKYLVAHSLKEFDLPYLCKRAVINGLELPPSVDVSGKKPWEINHKDTMEMWRYGDLKAYVSLESLCLALGVDSPKETLSGDQISEYYHSGGDMRNVVKYCEGDAVAMAQCYLKMVGIYE